MDVQTLPYLDYVYPEDDMSESQVQRRLAQYLIDLMFYLFAAQRYLATGNVKLVPTPAMHCTEIVPDAMLIEQNLSDEEQDSLGSWNMNEPNRTAPTIAFEIASESTWPNDIDVKPEHYSHIGVREYFAYDPQRFWRLRNDSRQVRGWRYSPGGHYEEIQPETTGQYRGRLYSQVLDSYLVVSGRWLRMYDQAGNMRLTGQEAAYMAERAERQARLEAQSAEQAERQARLKAEQAEKAERQAREVEQKRAEAAEQAREMERQRAERLAQKLRELGFSEEV